MQWYYCAMLIYWNEGPREYHNSPIRPYRRNVWEFQAVLEGAIKPVGPDVRGAELRERSLWLFAPQNTHGWGGVPGTSARILVFHFSQVPPPLLSVLGSRSWLSVPLSDEELLEMEELLSVARWAFRERTALSALHVRQLVDRLSILLCAHVAPGAPPPEVEREGILASRAEAILQAEATAALSIGELAARLGTSVAHLRRVFTAVRGHSPQKARERIVMERARSELLAEPERSILDIALAYGYSDHSSFTKAYRRYWAESPQHSRMRVRDARPPLSG